MNNNKHLGICGETVVAEWLTKNGFIVLAKNFRSRYGEIDLIAKKVEVVVFVEVKTRTMEYFPTSIVVTKSKQSKMIKTAKLFALQHELFEHVLRFDVATVKFDGKNPQIFYIPNAFTL